VHELETDYLIVGAGAAGMAFADSLVTESDADVVMVDRRDRPGGHWRNAYSFVRLHQPSPFYGVNSRRLGNDSIDQSGSNAGLYERATGAEVVAYFDQVLDEQFLPSGRVRFFGMSDYVGGEGDRHRFASNLTGETTEVRVRKRWVDATYQQTRIPSTTVPSFGWDPDVTVIPVNGLVDQREPADSYTVLGAGKTAMDACCWLLDNGVDPGAIRSVRPRDAWFLDRSLVQPREMVGTVMDGTARSVEAAATAESLDDLFARLDDNGYLLRIDESVTPTMYRCATMSRSEIDSVGSIEDVVRLGRVRHVGADAIELDHGSVPTRPNEVIVDCTAEGLRVRPPRPVFEPTRITPQQVRTCQPTFNSALIAFVETLDVDDAAKNGLCPPNPYPSAATDLAAAIAISTGAELAWFADPDVSDWLARSRLNATFGLADHMDEPETNSAVNRFVTNAGPAIDNLHRLGASFG